MAGMTMEEYKDALQFVVSYLKRGEMAESVFLTYLCGHFKTYPKKAKVIMADMEKQGMIKRESGIVTIWKRKQFTDRL